MTLAALKALWVLLGRALLSALWVIEHLVLVAGALRAGEPVWRAVLWPLGWARRSGRRAAALRWWVYLLSYVVMALLR